MKTKQSFVIIVLLLYFLNRVINPFGIIRDYAVCTVEGKCFYFILIVDCPVLNGNIIAVCIVQHFSCAEIDKVIESA